MTGTLRDATNLGVMLKKYWKQRFRSHVNEFELYLEKHGESLKNFKQVGNLIRAMFLQPHSLVEHLHDFCPITNSLLNVV